MQFVPVDQEVVADELVGNTITGVEFGDDHGDETIIIHTTQKGAPIKIRGCYLSGEGGLEYEIGAPS